MDAIYTLIETAENAVHEQRFELAQALAAIAQARAMARIAEHMAAADEREEQAAIAAERNAIWGQYPLPRRPREPPVRGRGIPALGSRAQGAWIPIHH